MTTELSEPSAELAARLLEEVDAERQLAGVKMSAMGGSSRTPLRSIPQAASFLQIGQYEELVAATGRVTIGYIDPAALARWIEGVFEDDELARAIEKEADEAEFYGQAAPHIKALLEIRLQQAREVLGPEKGETPPE